MKPAGKAVRDRTGPAGPVRRHSAERIAQGCDAPLHEIMATMRAMRRLSPNPLPRELLEKLVEAATWAPSGGNAQGYSRVIVTDPRTIRGLQPLWARMYDLYYATIAPVPGDTMDADTVDRLRAAVCYQRDHFAEIPALLVACYDSSAQRRRLFRRLPTAIRALATLGRRRAAAAIGNAHNAARMAEAASVYPGVQNLLLTARAVGLGANLTTWHLAFEGEFKKALGIPKHVRTFAVIPVGWPMGRFGPTRRRPATDVIHWDMWTPVPP